MYSRTPASKHSSSLTLRSSAIHSVSPVSSNLEATHQIRQQYSSPCFVCLLFKERCPQSCRTSAPHNFPFKHCWRASQAPPGVKSVHDEFFKVLQTLRHFTHAITGFQKHFSLAAPFNATLWNSRFFLCSTPPLLGKCPFPDDYVWSCMHAHLLRKTAKWPSLHSSPLLDRLRIHTARHTNSPLRSGS